MRLFNFHITTLKHFEKMQARCDETAWQRLRHLAHDEKVQRAVLAASWSVLPEHISLAQDTSTVRGIIRALNEFVRQCDSHVAPKALGSNIEGIDTRIPDWQLPASNYTKSIEEDLAQLLERELGFDTSGKRNDIAQTALSDELIGIPAPSAHVSNK